MSLNMFHGETDKQKSSMNLICIKTIQGMEQALQSIDSFSGSIHLQGETYQSAKMYMSLTLRPLAQGIIYLCEELIRQNDKYPDDFKSQVSSADMIEQEVIDQIQEVDRLIYDMENLSESLPMMRITIMFHENIKRKLQQKLNNLYQFNTISSSHYDTAIKLASSISEGLAQIQESNGFNRKTGTFSAKEMDLSWIATIDEIHYTRKAEAVYADYLKDYPYNLEKVITIIRYEESHSEYVDQTNDFLSSLEQRDIIEIKYLMYTAEEPYRTLSMKYLDRFEIMEVEAGSDDDGVFWPNENKVTINISNHRRQKWGNYYTFFHEIAHAIDYYYGQDNGAKEFFTDEFEIEGKTLSDHMYKDVENNLRLELDKELSLLEYEHLSSKERERMVDNITNNLLNQNIHYDDLTLNEKKLQRTMEILYKRDLLDVPDNNTASDIYGGVTNKVIEGRYSHKDDYWFDKKGRRIREPNQEGFAEYYGRIMVPISKSRAAGLESIQRFLPESKEFMDKVFDEME